MSKKSEFIDSLLEVKKYHQRQTRKIKLLMIDVQVEGIAPINKKESFVGQWFYEQPLSREYLGSQLYEQLEMLHTQWHMHYAKIYQIFFKKSGFFKKLSQQKPSEFELDKAKAYYGDLEIVSEEFLSTISTCEKRLHALSESKFSAN